MDKVNFSFIIPHKNCPNLLQRCIDSIPAREDIQIIVVDDNSDEDKVPKLQERKGLEVVLLDKCQAKGAGRARNVGIDHAKGEWLLFADADDYYTQSLTRLLNNYETDEKTDIVYLNANAFDEDGVVKPLLSQIISNYFKRKPLAEIELRYNLWTPWSRMVKKHVVNNNHIRFDEIPAGNDVMFGLKSGHYSQSIAVEKDVIYMYYRPRQRSQTDKQRNINMLDARLCMTGQMINFYLEVGYPNVPSLLRLSILSSYVRGMSLRMRIKLYFSLLSKYNISLSQDLYRYFHAKLYRKRVLSYTQ